MKLLEGSSGMIFLHYSSLFRKSCPGLAVQAAARLPDTCPPVPAPVCQTLAAASLWWQIQINPDRRTLDAPLIGAVQEAIALYFPVAGSYCEQYKRT